MKCFVIDYLNNKYDVTDDPIDAGHNFFERVITDQNGIKRVFTVHSSESALATIRKMLKSLVRG